MRITVMGVLIIVGGFLLLAFIVNQLQRDPTGKPAQIDEPNPLN
jgi:hypothetical protein